MCVCVRLSAPLSSPNKNNNFSKSNATTQVKGVPHLFPRTLAITKCRTRSQGPPSFSKARPGPGFCTWPRFVRQTAGPRSQGPPSFSKARPGPAFVLEPHFVGQTAGPRSQGPASFSKARPRPARLCLAAFQTNQSNFKTFAKVKKWHYITFH